MSQAHTTLSFSNIDGALAAYLLAKLFRGEPAALESGPPFPGSVLKQGTCGFEEGKTLRTDRTLLIICPNSSTQEQLAGDLEFFLTGGGAAAENPVLKYPSWEVLPFDEISPAPDISSARLAALDALLRKDPRVILATPEALMQKILSPAVLQQSVFSLAVGQELERDELLVKLDSAGFIRTRLVEESGQAAVRGAVVDVFPAGRSQPVRIEFFGDVIESIRLFATGTQRSLTPLAKLSIVPVREFLLPDSLALDAAIAQVKARASELDIPSRRSEALIDAVRHGSRYPGLEHIYPLVAPACSTLWDYLHEIVTVAVVDELSVVNAADKFQELIAERSALAYDEGRLFPESEVAYESADAFTRTLESESRVYFNTLEILPSRSLGGSASALSHERQGCKIRSSSNQSLMLALESARKDELPLKPLAEEIHRAASLGQTVCLAVSQKARIKRVEALLAPYGITSSVFEGSFLDWHQSRVKSVSPVKPPFHRRFQQSSAREQTSVVLFQGFCSAGVQMLDEGFRLILETEIFPWAVVQKSSSSVSNVRRFLGSVSQMNEDDYVVHIDHGVGIYRGLRQIEIDGKIGDFLALEYANEAKLFVPVDNIGKVQKYVGAEGRAPALNKLGGTAWEKSKAKIKSSVAELAGQLINLYAARETISGHSFGAVDEEDYQFAELFPFSETPDQHKAIEDVLSDMDGKRPMDRLVCGDVGYGKTEVAMRAAFKAVNAGKQAAVLVPTTILADQHYASFLERFAEYPMNIGCLSRFFSSAQNKETLAALSSGKLDIVIGTHRLLQRDVFFKDLGLVVVDEEHRFGVAHKERLKKFRREVDVLTLTATPIPRTLHMSMMGIRDLSVIETPPVNRQVIRTYVAPYNEGTVREAILRELGRDGQVFYLHNRVSNIKLIADEVAELVPEARVEFAHGQMKDKQLELVMHRFLSREIDVLVSTTIIESGLDIPNANTIIISKADRFGLAELYQLRGRVGRSHRRAYAYLMISDPKTLGVDAKKRLRVLQSLDDLGVGFRLALQDMEIRGAGNLLGKDQSGTINAVGFELYTKILKAAVKEQQEQLGRLRVEEIMEPLSIDPEINIGFPAHIPPEYIPDVAERLLLYQRLVELRDERHGYEIAEEIEDRFGRMPDDVQGLIELMILRSLLRNSGVISLSRRREALSLAFHPKAQVAPERMIELFKQSDREYQLSPDMVLKMGLDDLSLESPLDYYALLKDQLASLGIAR